MLRFRCAQPVPLKCLSAVSSGSTQETRLVLDAESCMLWWANKQMERPKKLHEHIGKNEKTKIVAKLTPKGAGAPVREPAVTKDQQKDMMAFYYKKQEEFKRLEADKDDSFLAAKWADGSSLKQSLTGTGNISWKPR